MLLNLIQLSLQELDANQIMSTLGTLFGTIILEQLKFFIKSNLIIRDKIYNPSLYFTNSLYRVVNYQISHYYSTGDFRTIIRFFVIIVIQRNVE